MRRRDLYALFALAGLSAWWTMAHWTLSRVYVGRLESAAASFRSSQDSFKKEIDDLSRRVKELEERPALSVKSSDEVDEYEIPPDTVVGVVGYGQTKSSAAIYVYRDLRLADGSTRREFVHRIPFPKKSP